MGGSAGSYLNPVKAFTNATTDVINQGKILASGKGKLSNFVNAADDIGSLGGGQAMGLSKYAFGGGANPAATANPSFNLDPMQSANDQAAINALGQSQFTQTNAAIDTNAAAQNQAASNFFQQSLPGIAENSQAAHLYDSTGYGQEVARQQAAIANQVASNTATQKMGATQALQGYQTGALQRGMSLEDFTNQANVAKAIGATMVPQAPNSKATGLSGGAQGAAAGSTFGPWGAAIGGGAGLLMGSQASNNPKGK